MSSIEERLTVLERNNRRLKIVVSGVFIFALGVLFWTYRTETGRATSLTAQQFVLVDSTGKPRGGLALGPDGPFLSLRDADGKERVLIGLAGGTHVTLRDADEISRIVLGIVPTGPGLVLYDSTQTPRAQLDVGDNGPRLYFENQFGYQATVGNYFVPGNDELNKKLRAMTFSLTHNTLGPIWKAP